MNKQNDSDYIGRYCQLKYEFNLLEDSIKAQASEIRTYKSHIAYLKRHIQEQRVIIADLNAILTNDLKEIDAIIEKFDLR